MGDAEEVAALRKHAIRWRFRGMPIFDEDTDEVIGITTEPEWEWSDLTDAQRIHLEAEAAASEVKYQVTTDMAMWAAAGDNGVTCPHRWENHEPWFRECARCRMSYQLPGRVVWVGDQQMRVSEPPPRVLRLAVPSPPSAVSYVADTDPTPSTLGPEIEEYEWTGRSYVKIAPS